MHELSIAMAIQRAAHAAVEDAGGGRLETARVAVGELSGVEPDLLRYAWEAVTQDGGDEGARLDIVWRAARQFCPDCGEEKTRAQGSWLRLCPDCQSPLQVEGGKDLDLLQVVFEEREVLA